MSRALMPRVDVLRWLAFHALDGERVTEADLAGALGLDRVELRAMVDCGRALEEARRAAAIARAESARRATQDAATTAGVVGPRAYAFVDDALTRLFTDEIERTTGEVARAMSIDPTLASKRLARSSVVERVRQGVWKRRGAT